MLYIHNDLITNSVNVIHLWISWLYSFYLERLIFQGIFDHVLLGKCFGGFFYWVNDCWDQFAKADTLCALNQQ